MSISTISWVDHDQTSRQQTYQLMASFRDSNSRDEMGIGTIRDSISDFLFPGTSTIQTRLRYMLLIPWIYRYLEKKRTRPNQFGTKAEELERSLIRPLIEADDSAGAFGKTSKEKVQRLPSSVYWNGLWVWNIRQFNLSQGQYYKAIGKLYSLMDRHAKHLVKLESQGDSPDDYSIQPVVTWDPEMPEAPPGFPENVEGLHFGLSEEEAGYLCQKLKIKNETLNPLHQGDCLLSQLAHTPMDLDEFTYPWDLMGHTRVGPFNTELLDHAQRFSLLMEGAQIYYNLMVAEKALSDTQREERENEDPQKLVEQYQEDLIAWADGSEMDLLKDWSLERFWEVIRHPNHEISHSSKFTEDWLAICLEDRADLLNNERARTLIREREARKGAKSRLHNKDARDRWGGRSGSGRLTYRWQNVVILLKDLYQGLEHG